jgi:thiol:disulfide interchange protein DsbG
MNTLRNFVTAVALVGIFGAAAPLAAASMASPRASTTEPAAKWDIAAIQNATSIVEGASGADVKTTVYVFMDPNCIYCHYTWKALQPYEAHGLQVHWIPLGFLKPDSVGKAAALLQHPLPAEALKQTELTYVVKTESGGIAPLTTIPADIDAKLKANMALFEKAGFEGTPTVIYKDTHGKWIDIDGMPKLSTLPAILNLPKQTLNDPELKLYN